ncbi:thiamine pyrophosphate-dependent dehydrogenase E1 component subunit alpha [Crocosphaera watsonii]|uniref:Pyruvate dehydrogenase E1 component alpha subunit n=3 Tax=Crocosphaera watsonii TaxID=263511 RepID=T2JII1_CROWT|nr:thiamine pyrophosphate-dependent dehydrogenase E1 component subunit alpha [Crocosphaera watsonii]EHJ11780.1 Pyruvate dehydrogenase (lipoamide) [Crocosphaera watsonii WH 0003]CCQ53683.1 Pyruvate dehydrogenase E1 component alpha subunit [Crocosphaera watsonii WH 0005]CCQ64921.1 Pyruvate dehydrogenase E1 component alpha subunit [Crocosphaera watsonii WH 0402]
MSQLTTDLGRLSDPHEFHEPIDIQGTDTHLLIEQLKRMILIRKVEELVADMVESKEARCPCHLAIGQEATAVGVSQHLTPSDRVFGCHRSHAHYLALDDDPYPLLAEILGKVTGCSKGMGGSMHLYNPQSGLKGTVPIVGATIPIATGAALAAKMDNNQDIAIAYFGDGATEEGVFHESLNMASVMGLPIIFVCENNLFSSHLHISLRQPFNSTSRYALAHGVTSQVVDGNNIVEVSSAMATLVKQARENRQPGFLESVTYRWRGHVGHREDIDVGVKRKSDLTIWKKRDPIARLTQSLLEKNCLSKEELDSINQSIEQTIKQAIDQARKDPYPEHEQLLDCVYYIN